MVDYGDRRGGLRVEAIGQVVIAGGGAPVACPDTLIGILKLPVNAARSAGDVKTVVSAAELLVTGAKSLPLVPASSSLPSNGEALNVSVTDGTVTGITPVGTLIARLALVVPSIVVLDGPRFSAWNSEVYEPDVTRSTSVKVPIVELKYRNAWVATLGSDSRFGNVAVWVMVAEGLRPPAGEADRSCRPSRGRTERVSRRRGRWPLATRENSRSQTVGKCILHSLTRGFFVQPEDRAYRSQRRCSGRPAWQASSVGHHTMNGSASLTRGRFPRRYPYGSRCHLG